METVNYFLIALIIVSLGMNFYVHYDYNTQLESVQSDLGTKISLTNTKQNQISSNLVDFQNATNTQINNVVESVNDNNKIITENIKTLDNKINVISGTLSSNIQALGKDVQTLNDVTNQNIEVLSDQIQDSQSQIEDLEGDIQDLDGDFSDFITDLYPAIVSIKTNLAQGSGFFVRSNGYIATNYHVIEGADWVQVVLSNGNVLTAQVVGSDENYDISVLKVSGSGYLDLDFENINNIKVGQKVVAVGNPLGLSFSLTQGVISAMNRVFTGIPVRFIQTDTAINPGNSGGPMIDIDGKVIGIATAVAVEGQNIGFAIPSDQAESIINGIVG